LKVPLFARALALAVLPFAACDATSPVELCVSSPVLDGLPATPYPEAVVIEMSQHGFVTGACTGALVAPRVVLTAGHCVASYAAWGVVAPLANESATSTTAETFDWTANGTDQVTENQHDVGLIYLDTPMSLAAYPALADVPMANGSDVVSVGRVHDGMVTGSLYLSGPLVATSAGPSGFPFDYLTGRVIEQGDSGGPVEVPGGTPHTIVAVNSGFSGTGDLLARVDLLKSWIQGRIASHGGYGRDAAAPAPAPIPAPGASSGACGSAG
jgi:hypothetical protein